MEAKQDKSKPQELEQFAMMSVDNKIKLFAGLPIPAQKLLVGGSTFASNVQPEMARVVSKLSPEKFEEAEETLLSTPYFSKTEDGRLERAPPMKEFINTDLKRVWEQQKADQDKSHK